MVNSPVPHRPLVNWLRAWAVLTLFSVGAVAGCTPEGDGASGRPTVPTSEIGPASYCRRSPAFVAHMDLSPQASIGTALEGVMGLAIIEPATGRVTQAESWDDAGYLGPFTYDGDGNVFTAPVPLVSLLDNPPAEQNKVYRVDTDTAEMREWIDLEPAMPPGESNPFGLVALTHDCDTNSLYAASLMGSTPDEEHGRVFRIDVGTATVVDVLEGLDAMGVGVFTGRHGKRLYFGHARSGALRSIALDENGDFMGQPRHELHLADLQGGRDERIQRITFAPDGQMLLKGIPFRYTLRGAFDTANSVYTVRYVADNDTWELVSLDRG